MKSLLKFGVIILIFLFSACEKDKSLVTLLDGTWELRSSKGKPDNIIYKFSGNHFQRTIGLTPSSSGTFKISKITKDERNSGVVAPYKITFVIDGAKFGNYLKVSDSAMVLSNGYSLVDDPQFIYDKAK